MQLPCGPEQPFVIPRRQTRDGGHFQGIPSGPQIATFPAPPGALRQGDPCPGGVAQGQAVANHCQGTCRRLRVSDDLCGCQRLRGTTSRGRDVVGVDGYGALDVAGALRLQVALYQGDHLVLIAGEPFLQVTKMHSSRCMK